MIITYVRRRVQRNPGQTLILIVLGGLSIPSFIIDYFTREESPLFQYVDMVAIRATFGFEIPHLAQDPLLLEELKMKERSIVALT